MSLRTLAIVAGGASALTAQDRLLALTAVPADADLAYVKGLVARKEIAWMDTLVDVGLFDIGTSLSVCKLDSHARKATQRWAEMAREFLTFFGTGSPGAREANETTDRQPAALFRRKDEMLSLFDKATLRLAGQADLVHGASFKPDPMTGTASDPGYLPFPTLDSFAMKQSEAAEVLALWAGVACALNRPAALKALIDGFPEAMSTAVPATSILLTATLKNNAPADFFGTNMMQEQRVSPLFCAIHASSMACMNTILDKRAEMGLSLDAPITDDKGSPKKHPRTFMENIALADAYFAPEVPAHAVKRILAAEPQLAPAFGWAMQKHAKDNPNLFTLCVPLGVFHGGEANLRLEAMQEAVRYAPKAMPEMLKRVDWDELAPAFLTKNSPVYKAAANARAGEIHHREDALLALFEKARVDGREDVVFQTYAIQLKNKETSWPAPVAMLSITGFERVLLAYLDHGYDPKAKTDGATHTLIELAELNNHSTLGMMVSHAARSRAHGLLGEIDDTVSKAPKPS